MLQWHKMLRIGVRKISEMSPSILSQHIGTISGPNPIKPALSQIHLQKAVTAQPEWRLAEQPGRSNLGQHQHQKYFGSIKVLPSPTKTRSTATLWKAVRSRGPMTSVDPVG